MKPTPETDSFITYAIRTDHNWRELARKLERERDEWKDKAQDRAADARIYMRERDEARAENEAMRGVMKDADALLTAIGYAKEDATRSKLQPYITK